MKDALARHQALLEHAVAGHGGRVFKLAGDGVLAAFARAGDGVRAALQAQGLLQAEAWPPEVPIRVRMALHTGPAELTEADYVGPTVNRCARLVDLGHGGQILVSLACRQALSGALPADIAIEDLGSHRLRDLAQPERVFQVTAPGLPDEFPALRSLDRLPHNLPVRRSRFVGRERVLAEVEARLASAHLLTLTGPGGAGKTRLAQQVAGDLVHLYPDGVWFVSLEALREPDLVPHRVAVVLGVAEVAGLTVTESLIEHLRPLRILLVLDNCEHLVEACALLAGALLAACPTLRILATSREPLGIEAETTWPVPLMALPDGARLAKLSGGALVAYVLQFESVQLFEARARAASPAFAVTAENARAVADVCRRLDGMPLAIELAAARVSAMTVDQILSRLDQRFGLLSAGRRDAVPRHQALRSLVDWSHDLLTEPEKALFRRLAVFRGGWSLEAAESVAAFRCLAEEDVAELFSRLVAKSLVRISEGPVGARYGMLATVMDYASEELAASEDEVPAHERLLGWCASLSERAYARLAGPDEADWLRWLMVERDNVRAALAWSTRRLDAGAGTERTASDALRLAGTMAYAWERQGLSAEALDRLSRLLALPATGETSPERCRALVAAGRMACRVGEYDRAMRWATEARALAERLGCGDIVADAHQVLGFGEMLQGHFDAARRWLEEALALQEGAVREAAMAETLQYLGAVATEQGDADAAVGHLRRSLALRRRIGDRRGTAATLNALANVADREGDIDTAYVQFFEGLQLARELDDRQMQALVLNNLGWLAGQRGDLANARPLLDESLRIKREHGDRRGMATTLLNLGDVSRMEGDLAGARTHYEESLRMRRDLRDLRGIAESLESFAKLGWREGRHRDAARWLGAAAALREVIGSPVPPNDRADYDQCAAGVRAALGDVAFGEGWLKGAAASWEVAAAEALGDGLPAPAARFPDGLDDPEAPPVRDAV